MSWTVAGESMSDRLIGASVLVVTGVTLAVPGRTREQDDP